MLRRPSIPLRINRQITEVLRRHLHLSKADARDDAIRLLRAVGIATPEARLQQYPGELSGGLRQRVVIAIALACNPQLLLADEPTTALDVTVQAQILDLLGAQQRARRMAMILVSHDLSVVAGRTDRVAVMYAGRIVETGPTAALFDTTLMPYTQALLAATPSLDQPRHSRLRTIAGRPPGSLSSPNGCRFAARCEYVQARCHHAEPPLVASSRDDHLYRCWYPLRRDLAPAATVLDASGDPPG